MIAGNVTQRKKKTIELLKIITLNFFNKYMYEYFTTIVEQVRFQIN